MANVQLNSDIYAHLLSFVQSPSDLLAVGLANKELLVLAEPEMIYRSIRCKLGNDAVWMHLISHPVQAARVHKLEIMRENFSGSGPLDDEERSPDVTRSSILNGNQSDKGNPIREQIEHSEHLLIRAIQHMVNLESFVWDRWVPAINEGEDVLGSTGETHSEDIWTALRYYTRLRQLKVVDLGRQECCFEDPRPIFDSTFFMLNNLTHLDLKMYYSPQDPHDEGDNGTDDEDSDEELLPPRVNLGRIYDMLNNCPQLQSLTLTIIDHDFYWSLGGNPFTDISSIISQLHHLNHLETLILRDITVRNSDISNFISNHPRLRVISASLSLVEDDLPETPFGFESYSYLNHGLLPNIESLNLPSKDLRTILRSLKRPSPIHTLGILQPQDWHAADNLEYDENYVSSLDDVWGAPPEGIASEVGPTHGSNLHNLLTDLSNLRTLAVKNVTTIAQLNKLIDLAPNVESISFQGRQIVLAHNDIYTILPTLSRWPQLTTLKGSFLFPVGYDINSEEIQSLAAEITSACPTLREVTYSNGQPARLTKTEDGRSKLELIYPRE